MQLLSRSDRQDFRFVWIELQTVLQVPLSDVGGACSENRQPGGGVVGAHTKVELCVVSVLMILHAVVCDDIGHWAAVEAPELSPGVRQLRAK